MTPDQITLVQDSFREVVPIKEAAAALFYEKLFALDGSLKPLFRESDMKKQGAKLMAALGFVTHGLSRAETILPTVQDLARRHVGYGVEEHHYATVGQALIQTLSLAFGERFTPELRNAWLAAYGAVSGVMIAAARNSMARGIAAE